MRPALVHACRLPSLGDGTTMHSARPFACLAHLLLALLIGGVPLGCAPATLPAGPGAAPPQPTSAPPPPPEGGSPRRLPQPDFAGNSAAGALSIADIAERVTPSVVSISSTKVRKSQPLPFPFGFPFDWGPPRQRREQGLGSGVMIRDGVIVTNNHVVADADEVKATTHDDREFSVEVVGTDPKSDLAVLRLLGDTSGLRPIEMGDSSRLRLGDVVLAIGNPFGVGQTVTMGIVSAKGRADVGIIDYEDFIQTDAAINPGNSGGALVDMEGRLVGIPTAILSRSGGYQGIGFAIPTNMARPIVDSLLRHGKVARGWLGVAIQDINQDLAKALGLPSTSGVLVSDVTPGSPAAKGGLKRGDVVLKVDGKTVETTGRLRNLVATSGASAKVNLEVFREGRTQTLQVALGERPESEPGQPPSRGRPGRGSTTLDGLTLETLSPQNRAKHGISPTLTHGVIITGVRPGSSAERAGLRPGDVVLEVDRKKVADLRRFTQLWRAAQGKTLLWIHRRGVTRYVVVDR